MIAIIDYKVGNLLALKKMIEKVGGKAIITCDSEEIKKADKLILPGVGSFDYGMFMLQQLGLIELLNELVVQKKIPVLGICLGMQLMARGSEEGNMKGLCWIPGDFIRFDNNLCKVPHMGWNYVNISDETHLFKQTNSQQKMKFYFDHSYYLKLDEDHYATSLVEHSIDFPASVRIDNIYATQFHPEKSLKYGMLIIKNFMEI